jgi:hypothetical protein
MKTLIQILTTRSGSCGATRFAATAIITIALGIGVTGHVQRGECRFTTAVAVSPA